MAWDLPADQPAPASAEPARTDASNLSTSRPRLEGALRTTRVALLSGRDRGERTVANAIASSALARARMQSCER